MPKSVNPLKRPKTTSKSPLSQSKSPSPLKRPLPRSLNADISPQLPDLGLLPPCLADPSTPASIPLLVSHILATAFSPLPSRASGLSSTQISTLLRFRARLPPIVSLAHLHALSPSPTATERALAQLLAQGLVRRVTIPGRGKGGAAVGEGLALTDDWKRRIREEEGLQEETKERYIDLMERCPMEGKASVEGFKGEEVRDLVIAGFLTNPNALEGGKKVEGKEAGKGGIGEVGYGKVTGTMAAVGGIGAIYESGGGGRGVFAREKREGAGGGEMTFSLPGTGAYLKLLTEARLYLSDLLKRISPRYKEATKDLLEEKWDGNVPGDAVSRAKQVRGEWTGVPPGRTKRWREFHGLQFEWVLAECVGSGLVELFDTGSVGIAVRVI